jgi:hypothetical protein
MITARYTSNVFITLGWIFAITMSIYILSTKESTSVQYTFDLSQSDVSTVKYELVLDSSLLDHNEVAWKIQGNNTIDDQVTSLCHGKFDLKDVVEYNSIVDDLDEKTGKHNPARKYLGNLGITTVAVGRDGGSANVLPAITAAEVAAQKIFPSGSLSSLALNAQCPAGAGTAVHTDHTQFDACNKLFDMNVKSAAHAGAFNAKSVDPPCANTAADIMGFASSGASSTALLWALETGVTSLEIINSSACDHAKLHDDTSAASEFVHINFWLAIATLVFVTFVGLPYVIMTFMGPKNDEDSDGYMVSGIGRISRVFEGYLAIFGTIFAILVLILSYMSMIALNDALQHNNLHDNHKDCQYHLKKGSHDYNEDTLTVFFALAMAFYGLALFSRGTHLVKNYYK